MKKGVLLYLFLLCGSMAFGQSAYVKFATNKGNIIVMLYDKTPKHQAMFLREVKKGTYKNAQFNRVIKSFVSQGGELDEPILEREKQHPEKKPLRLEGEFDETIFHKKGVLAAGRDDNPTKSSYYNQIYFVAGKVYDDEKLDAVEKRTGRKIPPHIREVYKTLGGTPHLDMDYTIFGEIIDGMEIAEAINNVATAKGDLPLEPVTFTVTLLSIKEVGKLRNRPLN